MTPKKVVLTGATGLIGTRLNKALVRRGDEVTLFTRSMVKGVQKLPGADEFIEWDYKAKNHWQGHIDGKDAVIHLSGANLAGKRWNKHYKEEIIESRRVSTANIVDAIAKAQKKPEVFICASAVGYYGDSGEELLAENHHAGNDFLAEVCKIWEAEAAKAEMFGVRTVSIRTGIVLSKTDGALKKMLMPYYLFAGGSLGNGRQWFPWIHINDIVSAYLFALDNHWLHGPINAASPNPVRMNQFADMLGSVLHRPSFFKVPKAILRLAIGEAAESITASLRTVPKKLTACGFKFQYPELREALENIIKKRNGG